MTDAFLANPSVANVYLRLGERLGSCACVSETDTEKLQRNDNDSYLMTVGYAQRLRMVVISGGK